MRYIHLRRVAALAAACTLSLATLAVPAGASGAPTGNAAAIHAYVQASEAMNKQPFMQFLIKSYYYLGYHSNGSWSMAWGYPKPPASYEQHVNATEITQSKDGKIVWVEITFAYACPSGSICFSTLTPLRFYVTKTAAYYAVLSGPNDTPTCWTNATKTWVKTDFEATGNPNWYPGTATKYSTASNFKPATTVGKTTTFVSTYEYTTDKSKVTETDTEDDTTHLFTHSILVVGKGDSKSYPAYTYSQTMSVPKGVKAPKINRVC